MPVIPENIWIILSDSISFAISIVIILSVVFVGSEIKDRVFSNTRISSNYRDEAMRKRERFENRRWLHYQRPNDQLLIDFVNEEENINSEKEKLIEIKKGSLPADRGAFII